MARTKASRKYQLTLNNPKIHDWSHKYIKNVLGTFSSLVYWCMCDEIGEEDIFTLRCEPQEEHGWYAIKSSSREQIGMLEKVLEKS